MMVMTKSRQTRIVEIHFESSTKTVPTLSFYIQSPDDYRLEAVNFFILCGDNYSHSGKCRYADLFSYFLLSPPLFPVQYSVNCSNSCKYTYSTAKLNSGLRRNDVH